MVLILLFLPLQMDTKSNTHTVQFFHGTLPQLELNVCPLRTCQGLCVTLHTVTAAEQVFHGSQMLLCAHQSSHKRVLGFITVYFKG